MHHGTTNPPLHKQYFLSSRFDYSLFYYSDGGPMYADDMGWQALRFDDIEAARPTVSLVDLKLVPEEQSALASLIERSPSRLFMLTVSDPYLHHAESPYYRFLLDMARHPNVVYLSKYQPLLFTGQLRDRVGPDRFFVCHHPYVATRAVAGPGGPRRRRVLFSGAMNESIYPERLRLHQLRRRNPALRLMVAPLEHPGYPDVGDRLKHPIVGEAYLRLLATYRFMFLSGSRFELEFLKYRECGYAGCVPVGFAPATFADDLRECVQPLDLTRPVRSLFALLRRPEAELVAVAARFAELQARDRAPSLLNARLDAFCAAYLPALGSRRG